MLSLMKCHSLLAKTVTDELNNSKHGTFSFIHATILIVPITAAKPPSQIQTDSVSTEPSPTSCPSTSEVNPSLPDPKPGAPQTNTHST